MEVALLVSGLVLIILSVFSFYQTKKAISSYDLSVLIWGILTYAFVPGAICLILWVVISLIN